MDIVRPHQLDLLFHGPTVVCFRVVWSAWHLCKFYVTHAPCTNLGMQQTFTAFDTSRSSCRHGVNVVQEVTKRSFLFTLDYLVRHLNLLTLFDGDTWPSEQGEAMCLRKTRRLPKPRDLIKLMTYFFIFCWQQDSTSRLVGPVKQ